MAKKAELLEKAKKLKLDVSGKNTIAELEAAIESAGEAPESATSTEEAEKSVTKAGKRSARALKEAGAEKAKEERKSHADEIEIEKKPKKIQKPTRSRLERRGKNFRKVSQLIEPGKVYGLSEAVDLATKTNPVKFDASVELHIRLNVDPKQADQNIRDSLVLPAGTGKTVRIAVFADEKADGADISGIDMITKQLDKSQINFDVLIATPANMPKLAKYARLLGPRGLMPNPKSGTVATDITKAVKEAQAGRVEYRVDSTGIVHLSIGKVSFGHDKLLENAQAVIASIKGNKPNSGIKGVYVKSAFVTTSMGPSIQTIVE